MSQFRSVGGLDEPISEDVDRGFFAVNQRLQLNQLQEGEVRESLNGRMEGYWKPRRGVVEKTAALTTGQTPLQLPIYLVGSSVLITAASVTNEIVTITTASAHDLVDGSTLNIGGIGYTAGTDPNGVFTATTASGSSITYPLIGGVGPYTVSAVSPVSEVITSTSQTISFVDIPVTGTVRITITAHGFAAGSTGWATISGLDASFNGNYLLTYVDANRLSYTIAGVTTAPVDKDGTLSQMLINDAANANVRASCIFSDPNTSNQEFVIVAMDLVAKKIDLSSLAITDIPYPLGNTVNSDTDMVQVFDKIMLFRDGQQALEWFPNGRNITSASQSGTTVTASVREHGLISGMTVTIAGLTGGTPANGSFVVTVTGQDTFTYVFTTTQSLTFGVAAATMVDGFTLSPGGGYTQPQAFLVLGTAITVTAGLVSITVSGNNTLFAGSMITIYETTIPEFSAFVGKEFQLVKATLTQFQFYAPIGNIASLPASQQMEIGGRFSVGGGFMHQPAAPWGIHFQRRLWVPYYYDQSGAFNSPVYTSRKITDEITVSDILDTTTFDQIENQFRISGGTADYVVGMHGFYDDALIVLNRNSLHIIRETPGSLLDVTVKELTSEIGCLARKSVVMKGNMMMFLTDDGVYALEFLNDYNLRGTDEPISKNIQPYIDRVNKNYASGAIGMLYDNRYYLAVPLDSSVGADDATGNNSILVYNFKNKGWESLDTYGDSRFLIKNLLLGGAGVRNDLYAVTSNGGLHQIDAAESSVDRLNVSNVGGLLVTPTINSSLTTRGYDLKTMERKRFTDAQIVMQNLANDTGEYNISFAAEDPDNASQIGTTTQFLGGNILSPSVPNEAETASIRCRLAGIRGYTGTLILTRTVGSPKINSVKVAGSVANRQIISQK